MRNSDKNSQKKASYVNVKGLHQSVLVLPAKNVNWLPFKFTKTKLGQTNTVFRFDKKKLLERFYDRTAIILRPEELDSAHRLRNKTAKDNFVCSKLAQRLVLGQLLNSDPYTLRFKRNRWGKPALLNQKLHFNISHSEKWLLLAVSQYQRVGIDLEQYMLAFDYRGMVDTYFHTEEKKQLKSTYSWAHKNFFKLWTRKEALAKVIGLGLHERLLSTNMLDSSVIGTPKKMKSFFVINSFHVDNQHIAALALRNDVGDPIFFNFS